VVVAGAEDIAVLEVPALELATELAAELELEPLLLPPLLRTPPVPAETPAGAGLLDALLAAAAYCSIVVPELRIYQSGFYCGFR